jgi:hypothetical protein
VGRGVNPNCNPFSLVIVWSHETPGQEWGARGSNPEPTD